MTTHGRLDHNSVIPERPVARDGNRYSRSFVALKAIR
ncbi:hypothetical protein SNOG_02958 [Parastagonospora nodorum SN15]|uniref:Uncharacterized protein n=1 Tax=Phaeosphaeria nodorum (strain SN15 / ATCC MYA-4574 / FGSC 10173) TaxID=321614 RepID=Q0UZ56_PHANO|nr:hypothetical protein SNOG_02958 [Parastagonospora nodorum SN15]EAT89689.1 hypothetical protein SNOG_02958 [Parastagonospora nodorum SN15]